VIVGRLAHVAFDVPDLEAAIRFYEAVLGLAAIARTDECVYLSGGRTATYEVCLRAGAARLDHLAFSVDSLATAGKQLEYEALDVPDEPGVRRAVATCLPGGQVIELIEESAPVGYRTSPRAPALNHCGVGPVTIEHITLLSDDIQADAEFAVDRLGFRITDSVRPPGEPWGNTHMRLGTQHHDLALLRGTGHDRPELHHVCFAVPSVSELVRLADSLATRGMALDTRPGTTSSCTSRTHSASASRSTLIWLASTRRLRLTSSTHRCHSTRGARAGPRRSQREARRATVVGRAASLHDRALACRGGHRSRHRTRGRIRATSR
jgi:catechol 2,3-dioxygenase-like lactoylglutathione lyase family enzyme